MTRVAAPHSPGDGATDVGVSAGDGRLSPWTLRFVAPTVESDFQRHHHERLVRVLRIGVTLLSIAVALTGPAERVLFPKVWPELWTIRYGFLLPVILAFGYVLTSARTLAWAAPRSQPIMAAGMGLTFAAMEAMAVVLLDQLTPELLMYFGLVFVICIQTMFLVVRIQFLWAAILSNLGLLASLVLVAWTGVDSFALASTMAMAAMANGAGLSAVYLLERTERGQFHALRKLEVERARGEVLLSNILPEAIRERLERDGRPIADGYAAVSVVFADVVGFTPLAARISPERLVSLLDRLFTRIDLVCDRVGAEKIKTIGDAYMAAVGLPDPREDHALAAVKLAVGMLREVQRLAEQEDLDLALRVGIHSGPVVAGVIGETRLLYDLWGDTVNTAARMESHGAAGRVQVSEGTAQALGDAVALTPRGTIEVKGKGAMATWWVEPGDESAESLDWQWLGGDATLLETP